MKLTLKYLFIVVLALLLFVSYGFILTDSTVFMQSGLEKASTTGSVPNTLSEAVYISDFCTFSADTEPSSLVIQVINNQIHKWYEYQNPIDGSLCIYMLEPIEKALDASEAEALLLSSREWKKQFTIYHAAHFYGNKFFDTQLLTPTSVNQKTETLLTPSESILYKTEMVDNRIPVGGDLAGTYPYNNVGILKIIFSETDMKRASGFLVSRYTALTNAHAVYSSDTGWFQECLFSPGQYEDESMEIFQPFSTMSPVTASISEQYINYANENNFDLALRYDYAALFFDPGFIQLSTFIPLEFNYIPEQVIVLGYPASTLLKDYTQGMWRSDGSITNSDEHCLYYDAYTSPGSSGSPVISYNLLADAYRVVAIQSFVSSNFSGGPHFNNINQVILEEWISWMPAEEPDEEPDDIADEEPDDIDNGDPEEEEDNDLVEHPFPGDINSDNLVNVLDVTLAARHVLGLIELSQDQQAIADVNGDGLVNVLDVTLIMQFALGLIDSFD